MSRILEVFKCTVTAGCISFSGSLFAGETTIAPRSFEVERSSQFAVLRVGETFTPQSVAYNPVQTPALNGVENREVIRRLPHTNPTADNPAPKNSSALNPFTGKPYEISPQPASIVSQFIANDSKTDAAATDTQPADINAAPQDSNEPWWGQYVQQRSEPNSQTLEVTLEDLLVRTLEHSSQVKVFSDLPLIRKTAIEEAEATFDWSMFAETKWSELSEPVGNTLTTGGPSRFKDDQGTYDWGMRRRTTLDTSFEAKQSFGYQNNNSIYFQPKNQGNARITLGFTQPLMRGGGRVYNTSLIVLADIDAEVAEDEFHRQLQSHLLEVTRAYWALYLERGALAQRYRLYERGSHVLKDLESRKSLDAKANQSGVRSNGHVQARVITRAQYGRRNVRYRLARKHRYRHCLYRSV